MRPSPNRILSDPLKSIWSLVHQRRTESLFSSRPEVEVDSESQFVFVPVLAFIVLDTVNVREFIAVRACVMKVLPAFLRGAYKSAMRCARILLFRPARGGKVPKNQLLVRLQKIANGECRSLGIEQRSV